MKSDLCQDRPAVLEYPFIYRNYDADIIVDLQYKTNILLASTQHKCKVLSGFSGYEPDKYIELRNRLDANLNEPEINLLKELGIEYIKLNKLSMLEEEGQALISKFKGMGMTQVFDDHRAIIFRIQK